MKPAITKGVYFLANDQIYDLTVAFLNSFRKCNPFISLCLIPFNDSILKISALSEKYNFSIWSDASSLEYCDHLSLNFHHNVIGQYRKLVMWTGIFDEFLYIDTDTIVLQNIDFVFRLLAEFDFLTSYSNLKAIEKWVWKESVYDNPLLTHQQIAYAANTGFIASKKGLLPLELVQNKVQEALQLKYCMELSCLEQAFLNYLIVTSGKKHTSLFTLIDSDLYTEKYLECWGGEKIIKIRGELYKTENHALYKILFIHWAGLWQKQKIDYQLFRILKGIGLAKEIWQVSLKMPKKGIWKRYR